jgi:hypothetical protein
VGTDKRSILKASPVRLHLSSPTPISYRPLTPDPRPLIPDPWLTKSDTRSVFNPDPRPLIPNPPSFIVQCSIKNVSQCQLLPIGLCQMHNILRYQGNSTTIYCAFRSSEAPLSPLFPSPIPANRQKISPLPAAASLSTGHQFASRHLWGISPKLSLDAAICLMIQ